MHITVRRLIYQPPARQPGRRPGRGGAMGQEQQREHAELDAERAYRELRQRIVTLAIPPGAVINETRMAAELGLGRTPVREALLRLQAEHVVRYLPRRGVIVREITLADVGHVYEARLAVEGVVARLACQRMTRGEQEAAAALVEQQARAHAAGEHAQTLALEERFHRFLAHCCGNPHLAAMDDRLLTLTSQLWHYVWRAYPAVEMVPPALDQHARLVAALHAGDAAAAERVMCEHIEASRAALYAIMLRMAPHPAATTPVATAAPHRWHEGR